LLVDGECSYDKLPESALEALSEGVVRGRDGKGVVYVFASGNELASGDDVNFGGLTNSRLTITVGGVGKDGLRASYSTPGAALFVSAPGGSLEAVSNHMAASLAGGCTTTSPGTSFAAPVVSGIVALMLEASPDLTWRDVQGIFATTSQFVADPSDVSATINEAGIWHSNYYGFGVVDADAAVSAAENWTLFGPEVFLVGESGEINVSIPDISTRPAVSTINVTGETEDEDLITESVAVFLQVEHFSRGDLEVTLRSPAGTVSMLTPGRRIENTQLDPSQRWKLLTVRNWGESAVGTWELSIRDLRPGDVAECADAPFVIDINTQLVTCATVETEEWCIDGARNPITADGQNLDEIFMHKVNGTTLSEACCACGGGLTAADVSHRLVKWKIVVYGQQVGFAPVQSTSAPISSFTPTVSPAAALDNNVTSVPKPASSPGGNSTDSTTPILSTKPSTTELAIIIGGVVAVFLLVAIAVGWACKAPTSAGKFTAVNKTGQIA
jgi:hypothetical protein